MESIYLTQEELADRLRQSPRTLEGWRYRKVGPPYVKLLGRVLYSIADIVAFERSRRAKMHSSVVGYPD
jgi:transcriptional regulator with XRE-family HTH domain